MTTNSINSVYFKKQLEGILLANDQNLAHVQNLFSFSNVLDGVILMITKIFGCDTKIFIVNIDHNGNIDEKLVRETYTNPDKKDFDIMDQIEIDNHPSNATLFRVELDYKGRYSEIYLDLFERNHKSNGT